jgi:hypothetical protein
VHLPRERPGDRIGASQLDVDFAILKHFREFGLLVPRAARTLAPGPYRTAPSGAQGDLRLAFPGNRRAARGVPTASASSGRSALTPTSASPGYSRGSHPGFGVAAAQRRSPFGAKSCAGCASNLHEDRAHLSAKFFCRAEFPGSLSTIDHQLSTRGCAATPPTRLVGLRRSHVRPARLLEALPAHRDARRRAGQARPAGRGEGPDAVINPLEKLLVRPPFRERPGGSPSTAGSSPAKTGSALSGFQRQRGSLAARRELAEPAVARLRGECLAGPPLSQESPAWPSSRLCASPHARHRVGLPRPPVLASPHA